MTQKMWYVCLGAMIATAAMPGRTASFETDANGVVVMEAENFDLNVTRIGGEWRFDSTPLPFDPYSGWGYMKGLFSGGTDINASPRLDYTVNFGEPGRYYIWVSGSDAGGKSVHVGLDGVVPPSANDIGGKDGAFGARMGGEIWWLSNHNDGSGYVPGARPYLDVPTAGEHTVNVFIREPGFYLDRLLLTPDRNFAPSPLFGGALSGNNVPPETIAPVAELSVAITQPSDGNTLYGSTNSLVTIVAKPATPGPPVTLVEFFSRTPSESSFTKIGEAFSLPYMMEWANSPLGTNLLMAVATDSTSHTATSEVVTVVITLPPPLTPLQPVTNSFDNGLGTFTLEYLNHAGEFDFGWQNSANAGGQPGELGGLVVRRQDIAPYVATPLGRPVSLDEELWFRGSMMFSNISANSDIFIGYFDTNGLARFGLKIREPTGLGVWRFSVEPEGRKIPITLPDQTPGQFELHWIPSGAGDGTGTLTGTVAGVEIPVQAYTTPNRARYNAFGWLAPTQGSTDPSIRYLAFFDDLVYLAPPSPEPPAQPVLAIERAAESRVLLHWQADGFLPQYKDGDLLGGTWTDFDPGDVVRVGSTYYLTNAIVPGNRWYRLRSAP